MNTQSHAIINLYLLRKVAKKMEVDEKGIDTIVVLGAILPDVPIFFFFGWYSFVDPKKQQEIWRTLYFDPGWQAFFNLFNSIPIFLALLFVAWKFKLTRLLFFSISCLLHVLEDFFIHMEDAHAHFYPFSNYKFMSPVSYWDTGGFGYYVSMIETTIVLVVSLLLFRHIVSWWGKGLILTANISLLGSHTLWRFIFRYL